MLRRMCVLGLAGAMILLASLSAEAVTKVGKRYNVIEFGAGYASPVGSYDRISIIDFIDERGSLRKIDADQVYDPSFSLGLSVAQVRDRWYVGLGFGYTKINQLDSFLVGDNIWHFGPDGGRVVPNFSQFDLRLNVNYQFTDLHATSLSPYVGLGLAAGLISRTASGYETEYDANTLVSANFGAELKIWTSPDQRQFVTLASVNSYDLLASGYRPRFLTIGGAVKLYMRPL